MSAILKDIGVAIRSQGTKSKLTADQIIDMAIDYEAGAGLIELAKKYLTSTHTIAKQLKVLDVEIRPKGRQNKLPRKPRKNYKHKLTAEQIAEAAKDYIHNHESLEVLAEKYAVSARTIRNEFKAHGVKMRPSWGPQHKLTAEQIAEAAKDYIHNHERLDVLAKKYGVSSQTIRNEFKAHSIEIRPLPRGGKHISKKQPEVPEVKALPRHHLSEVEIEERYLATADIELGIIVDKLHPAPHRYYGQENPEFNNTGQPISRSELNFISMKRHDIPVRRGACLQRFPEIAQELMQTGIIRSARHHHRKFPEVKL